jgi:hypothetical protein
MEGSQKGLKSDLFDDDDACPLSTQSGHDYDVDGAQGDRQ